MVEEERIPVQDGEENWMGHKVYCFRILYIKLIYRQTTLADVSNLAIEVHASCIVIFTSSSLVSVMYKACLS